MQTFLPYPNFENALAVLDTPRLGKQRVETLQILRALVLPEYGWGNHPAVRMWQGRLPALVLYGLTSVAQWERRGFGDSTAAQIAEFAPEVVDLTQADLAAAGELPRWLGDDRLHRSHRSKLLSKDPDYYGKYFPDAPPDLDYYWPEPDAVRAGETAPTGKPLWVVKPASSHALGQFVEEGMIALGHGSGISVDITGQNLDGLRQLVDPPPRRVNRPMAALARLLNEIEVGDEVAVLIQSGRLLIVGEIISDYHFVPATEESGKHQRRVRWDRLIPRSAVLPMSALQDVRPLFPVRLAADQSPIPQRPQPASKVSPKQSSRSRRTVGGSLTG